MPGQLIAIAIIGIFTVAFMAICGKGCRDAERTAMSGEMIAMPILWACAGVVAGVMGLATAFYILLGG